MRKQAKYRYKIIVTGETRQDVSLQLSRLSVEMLEGNDSMNVSSTNGARVMRKMTKNERDDYGNAYDMP